jgi:uncharacterized membrane protein
MAGIGFELEKLFERDTYSADTSAYLTAGFVLAGPWVFGVLAVVLITTFTRTSLAMVDQTVFLILATLAYAIGMFVTAALYLPVTRYVADRLYAGSADSFGPSYAAYCLMHWVIAVPVGMFVLSGADVSPTARMTTLVMIVACTQIWASATFVALLRTYAPVAGAFLVGYAVSAFGAIHLAQGHGLEGALIGFTSGLVILAVVLTATLAAQFAYPVHTNFGFLRVALGRPALVAIGVFLALGTWGDKFVIWTSDQAQTVAGNLRFFPPYDISFFLGYITAIPAFAHFLLRVETSFARHVRHVYQTLVNREPFEQIRRGKAHMLAAMNRDYISLLKVQAPITLLAVHFAPAVLKAMNLPLHQSHIVQFSALAAAAIVVLQVQILYLLYFDLAEKAVVPAGVYAVTNIVATWLLLKVGYPAMGLGHLLGAFAGATAGVWMVNRHAPQLEKITLVHFAERTLGLHDAGLWS